MDTEPVAYLEDTLSLSDSGVLDAAAYLCCSLPPTDLGSFVSSPRNLHSAWHSVVRFAAFHLTDSRHLERPQLLDYLDMPRQLLSAGEIAPDFQLPSAAGSNFQLHQALGHSAVVLFFYVQNFTPVCTSEVCCFRDHVEDFRHLKAQVYGVSPGSESLTRRFAEYHKLPFPLLLDRNGYVRKLYRVPKLLGFLPGRSTYLIGQNKRILQITGADLVSKLHITESLKFLRSEPGA